MIVAPELRRRILASGTNWVDRREDPRAPGLAAQTDDTAGLPTDPSRRHSACRIVVCGHRGFGAVGAYGLWAKCFDSGPLQISADGGVTTLALLEASEAHPIPPAQRGRETPSDLGPLCGRGLW